MSELESLWGQHFPDFAHCREDAVRRMMAAAKLVSMPGQHSVFRPGSPCGHFLLVTAGSVRVQLLTASGREVLLYRVRPGGGCVLTTSCLLGGDAYPAEGITEEPTCALALPEPVFRETLNQSPFFRQFVFRDFAARLSRVIARMEEVIGENIDARLARAILARSSAGPIRVTHHDLALEIGSAREVISRHLKQFEDDGWVRLGRGTLEVLDAAALSTLLGAESGPS